MMIRKVFINRYDIVIAKNGKEAVDLFLKENPDLVLMDIKMPVMDGFFAFDEMRRKSEKVNVPIIAVTAKAMDDEKKQIINYGFNDYISKPIDDSKLLKILDKYLTI